MQLLSAAFRYHPQNAICCHWPQSRCEMRVHHLLGVLLAVVDGSVDHVGQGLLGLLPLASLETAVGVDPELLRLEVPSRVC